MVGENTRYENVHNLTTHQFAEETNQEAGSRSPLILQAEGTSSIQIEQRLKEGKGTRSGYTLNSIIFLAVTLMLMITVSAAGLNAFEQNKFVSEPGYFVPPTAREFYGLMVFSIVGPLTIIPACALAQTVLFSH